MNSPELWNNPDIVRSFSRGAPSQPLLDFIRSAISSAALPEQLDVLDIGCGAGRNAVAIAREGHRVTGTDFAPDMLVAARARVADAGPADRCRFLQARMDSIPLADHGYDLIVAHGVWNLASTETEFRAAVAEAARLARSEAALYVTTFSRNTLPPEAEPVLGTRYLFTDFAGYPQCFLTADELDGELHDAGFSRRPGTGIRELNRPAAWERQTTGSLPLARPKRPVLLEGAWWRLPTGPLRR